MLVLAVVLFASSQLAHEAAFKRMTDATEVSESVSGRWVSYATIPRMALPAAGWFGIGPGLFQVAFPYQFEHVPQRRLPASGNTRHEDYLQTTLEWGSGGHGCGGPLCWWREGLYRAFRTYAQRERFASRTDRHLVLAGILGVLGTLAARPVRFPPAGRLDPSLFSRPARPVLGVAADVATEAERPQPHSLSHPGPGRLLQA